VSLVLSITVGVLFATGVFLVLRRSVLRVVIGLALISHGANLLIFVAGGVARVAPPVAAAGTTAPPTQHADPLPQALVLTAIVISFGVLAFLIALVSRICQPDAAGQVADDTDQYAEVRP
jgi:multicomponent Na+:H+ antiporter subunit C